SGSWGGWRGGENLHHDRRGVVAAGVFDSFRDQKWGQLLARARRAERLFNAPVPKPVDKAVGADEKAILQLEFYGADVRVDELVAGAERLVQGVAARVGARFAFIDATVAPEPADVAVVVGHLGEAALAAQVVDAAVADVAEVHPVRREPAQAQCRAHSSALLVGAPEFNHVGMNRGEELFDQIGKTAGHALRGKAEALGKQPGDP